MYDINNLKQIIRSITDNDIAKMEIDGISFNSVRKDIIRSAETLDFQAVPGSGKTTVLAAKLLIVAEKWDSRTSGICILSHTNVAKDTIIKKIERSGIGKQLLTYPHFIGTIQEFVDKYLAYPIAKFCGYSPTHIDTDLAYRVIEARLKWKTKNYLSYQHEPFNLTVKSLSPLTFIMPNKLTDTNSQTYIDLFNTKQQTLLDGLFYYEDMYTFAAHALKVYPIYTDIISRRFPLVFLDEAQDNNKIQDDILETLFNNQECIYQRFGDSDQAIYDFDNNKTPDTGTFGARNSNLSMSDSLRFSQHHLAYISKFKPSEGPLSAKDCPPKSSVDIFFYNSSKCQDAVQNFLCRIDEIFDLADNPIIRIIGAVGKNKHDKQTIASYAPNYKKDRAPTSIRYLIDVLYSHKDKKNINCNILLNDIIKFILKRHTIVYLGHTLSLQHQRLLKTYIAEHDPTNTLKSKIIDMIYKNIDSIQWSEFCTTISNIFDISTLSDDISEFHENVSFQKDESESHEVCNNNNCLYTPIKHIPVYVSTIHAAKGETHDATLVLETFHRYKDITYVLAQQSQCNLLLKFKKQLYVALTRAKHYLAIAVEDTPNNRKALEVQ